MSNIDIKLTKSKETLQILNMIEENPGTYGNEIAKALNTGHKTVKYHVDKLIKAELVRSEKQGRKNLLYPVIGKLKELKIDRKKLLMGKPESEP
jgi:predicted transcriptional regulator